MKQKEAKPQINFLFICVVAALMSIVALSIDTVLPAMGYIRIKFNVLPQSGHWILTSLFIGLSIGQIIFGPLSDTIGRKMTTYFGFMIFTFGSLLSYFAIDYSTFILGRAIQGLGVAAPRVVSQSIIRDVTSGSSMARLNSFVMSIFIAIPVIAPILGQFIIWTVGWNYIFVALIIYCIALSIIYGVLLEETLKEPRRFDFLTVWRGACEVFSNKATLSLTIATGCIFGPLISFLNIAQPLYQEFYNVGDKFSFYFAGTAIVIGIASLLNAKLVLKINLNFIVSCAAVWVLFWSIIFLILAIKLEHISLIAFLSFSILVFTTFGFLFSNINAMALEPMGHLAGTASSIIATISNIIALTIGAISSQFFSGGATPLITVFLLCSSVVILILLYLNKFTFRVSS